MTTFICEIFPNDPSREKQSDLHHFPFSQSYPGASCLQYILFAECPFFRFIPLFLTQELKILYTKNNSVVLKITCSDAKGLIYYITKTLYRHNLNIIRNDEYVDKTTGQFFMRTQFDGDTDHDRIISDLEEKLPDDAHITISDTKNNNIILMGSKEHHCLQDIVTRCEYGDLPARISCIISNHDVLEKIAERFDIPFYHICHTRCSREEHESQIAEIIGQFSFDYIVLAKYMRILSPEFVQRYPDQLINIHHSFLPAFKGARPYRQAFHRGVKIIGATAHFVNEDLDEGPIIEQETIKVNHGFSPAELSNTGKDVERIVLARALNLVLAQRVFIHGNKTIVF